jgi:nucleoside-diphosphate-sugar epimerase
VRVSIARLALSVHDGQADRKGFIPSLISLAREKGASACVGDGANRWTGVHRLDAARLFRLALENAPAGAKLHGVADAGVPFRQIAEAIGTGLGLPVTAVSAQDAEAHFGYLAPFVALDNPSSNAHTKTLLGWQPERPGLLEDIQRGGYLTA